MEAVEIRPINTRPVVSMAFQQSTGLLAVGQHGDEDGTPNLTLWDARTGQLRQIVEASREEYVSAVTFSRDGSLLYYTRGRGVVFCAPDGSGARTMDWDVRDVRRLEIHPDGVTVLTCGEGLDLWDFASDRCTWTLPDYHAGGIVAEHFFAGTCWEAKVESSLGYENYPALGTFSDDGSRLFVAGNNSDTLVEFDTPPRKIRRSLACSPLQITSISHCAGMHVVGTVGRVPGGVFLWDASVGAPMLEQVFNEDYTNTSVVAFSPSRELVLVGTTIGYLNLHALDTGRMVHSSRMHRGTIRCLIVSDGGEFVATGGDDGRVVISKLDTLS